MGEPVLNREEQYTYRELRSWPEGERWELIGGSAHAMASPRTIHQRLVAQLMRQLMDWFDGKACEPLVAPVDVFLGASPDQLDDEVDTVVVPDLLVVCDPEKVHENGVHGAPDWVIEVTSPSTAWQDQTTKRVLYEKHGVREYWVVNPDTLDVAIFRLKDGRFFGPRGANLSKPVPVGLFPGLLLGPS